MTNKKSVASYSKLTLIASVASFVLVPAVRAQSGSQSDQSTTAASSGLEEITVTARKREEKLQETPISISAFSAKGLEQRAITRIDEIANAVPNLTIKSSVATSGNSSSASFFIRGIGQSDFLLNVRA